jgi:hypothetical protein
VRKKRKASSEVPYSIIVECDTVSTGKRDFPEENIPYIFGIEEWKKNGIPFTKIGKVCFLLIRNCLLQVQ